MTNRKVERATKMNSISLSYPATFKKCTDDGEYYTVEFKDIENAITSGSTYQEAYEMAQDVLGLMLHSSIEDNKPALSTFLLVWKSSGIRDRMGY